MFGWRAGFQQKSGLEVLLEKQDVKIEEALDHDDLLQELRTANEKVVNFFLKPQSIHKLVNLSLFVDSDETDENQKFKYPLIACEVLVSLPTVFNVFTSNEELMGLLIKFLEQKPPLPSPGSFCFVRILQTLYTKKPSEVADYLSRQNEKLALKFLEHLETFGMNELILTLLGTMDEDENIQKGKISKWWMEYGFIKFLFSRLTHDYSPDFHINIIRMLSEIVRRFQNPNISTIADNLMTPEVSHDLMNLMMKDLQINSKSVIFIESTNLIIAIIDSLVRKEEMNKLCQNNKDEDSDIDNKIDETFRGFLDFTEQLVAFLRNPGELEQIELTWGTLTPPLGMVRLKVVELLLVLLKTKRRYVEDQMLQLNLLSVCLDLFFTYDMNNLLHILVDEIIVSCLYSENAELITDLFSKAQLLNRLIKAVQDDENRPPKSTRKGYFGHIISISNKIEEAKQNPMVNPFIESNQEWKRYVEGKLNEWNEKDKSILGGTVPNLGGNIHDPLSIQNFYQPPQEQESPPSPTMPSSSKYTVTMEEEQEDLKESERNADVLDMHFDARDSLGDDLLLPGSQTNANEDVWHERQIVDNSNSTEDWCRFDDPFQEKFIIPQSVPKLENNEIIHEDSSSDEEDTFIPSPTKESTTTAEVTPKPTSPSLHSSSNQHQHQDEDEHDMDTFNSINFWRPNWETVAVE
eukprot:NODE_832_length_2321_cov_72.071429_g708_i0.p1 GENE.NODE_832_length_2321_cov_72.071429_g708_i0~~NODE_832_length_2321_cov_72.071429_g708_i0.p1  ORF type:complete len:691 (-),score=120.11 NODE_832_length_2321_cov_72.071429_g708_i0:172-2244(-)